MFKLNAKFDADSLLYFLSHFECSGHTVHMLTQGHPPHPLISTVKSSLFTHARSSPLSLAARLHRCHTNHSHYINNGWIFQTDLLYLKWSNVSYTWNCLAPHKPMLYLSLRWTIEFLANMFSQNSAIFWKVEYRKNSCYNCYERSFSLLTNFCEPKCQQFYK